jgi:hypothetical protein
VRRRDKGCNSTVLTMNVITLKKQTRVGAMNILYCFFAAVLVFHYNTNSYCPVPREKRCSVPSALLYIGNMSSKSLMLMVYG